MVNRSVEDDDWDHLDFERDDHLEEFCRERLNRVRIMDYGDQDGADSMVGMDGWMRDSFWKDIFRKD